MTKEYEALSKVRLYKIKEIDLQELLASILLLEEQSDISFKKAIKELLATLFLQQIKIQTKGRGDIFFFFSPSYGGRDAIRKEFINVIECADDYIAFIYEKKLKFSFIKLMNLPIWGVWLYQLKRTKLSLTYRMYLADKLLSSYLYVIDLDGYIKDKKLLPKLGVTFCDVHPVDYLVTRYLNDRHVQTATLQHAVFEHKKFGWSHLFSHSKYFLGISEVAKHEAVLAGANVENYRILGPMKYIKEKVEEKKQGTTNIAGLALSGPSFEEQNLELFKYANEMVNECCEMVIVRPHPALDMRKYQNYMSEKIVLDDSKSMSEFAAKCDFVFMGNTNTFGDILVTGTCAFRMITDNDFFGCIDDFKFKDYQALKALVTLLQKNPKAMNEKIQRAKEMVCPSWNIRNAYADFFNSFIKE